MIGRAGTGSFLTGRELQHFSEVQLWVLIKDYARMLPSSCGNIVNGLFYVAHLSRRATLPVTNKLYVIHICSHLVYRTCPFQTKCTICTSVHLSCLPVSFRHRATTIASSCPHANNISLRIRWVCIWRIILFLFRLIDRTPSRQRGSSAIDRCETVVCMCSGI